MGQVTSASSIPEPGRSPRRARPPYLTPSLLALVFVGGACGTALRAWLEAALPSATGSWPWATFWINLSGALVLGFLLESLLLSGPDQGWRRWVRLGVGTGVMGGYTTYSSFIVEADQLLRGGHPWTGIAYALVSVTVGIACALVGITCARRLLVGRRTRTEGQA